MCTIFKQGLSIKYVFFIHNLKKFIFIFQSKSNEKIYNLKQFKPLINKIRDIYVDISPFLPTFVHIFPPTFFSLFSLNSVPHLPESASA